MTYYHKFVLDDVTTGEKGKVVVYCLSEEPYEDTDIDEAVEDITDGYLESEENKGHDAVVAYFPLTKESYWGNKIF